MLAIEADGAMYHSSETARDRDRLRQDHLQRLGWKFHRIWSTDWFCNRDAEVARTVAAFNAALAEPTSRPETPSQPPPLQAEHAVHNVAEGDSTIVTGRGRVGTKPFWPDGRPITEYYRRDLVRLITWITSDGRLRTDEEIIAIAIKQLGYDRTSAPRRRVLTDVITSMRATGRG